MKVDEPPNFTSVYCRTCHALQGEICKAPWRSNMKYATFGDTGVGTHKTRRDDYYRRRYESQFCNAHHQESQARCNLKPGHGGKNHQGYTHYPGQLVVWSINE